MWLYTTRGVGVIGPPARFNCRPEVTEITLKGMPGRLGSAVEVSNVEVVPRTRD
jgi:hypothetical protein